MYNIFQRFKFAYIITILSSNTKKILFAIALIFLILACCCGSTGLIYYYGRNYEAPNSQNNSNSTDGEPTPTDDEIPLANDDDKEIDLGSTIPSIYNEDIPIVDEIKVVLNELVLAIDVLDKLEAKGWDGKQLPLPLKISEFDTSEIGAMIDDEERKFNELTIPDQYLELYHSTESKDEIEKLIFVVYDEYIRYLEGKGVNQKYINRLKSHVLPPTSDRLSYAPENNPDNPPSNVQRKSGQSDFSKLEMTIYDTDIFNGTYNLEASKILGNTPSSSAEKLAYHKKLRDISLRWLLYHEFTHALQRAYVYENVSDESQRIQIVPFRKADDTLMNISEDIFWKWNSGSDFENMANNYTTSNESQADGVAFEIVTNGYDMSDQQRQAVWDHVFGRMSNAQSQLEQIRDITESNYPNFDPTELGENIEPIFKGSEYSHGVFKLGLKLGGLPAYVGYLNPMRPEDAPAFWKKLEK